MDEELEEEMQLYIFHFRRLSCLASNRVKKVSFNLACFLWDWEDNSDGFANVDELFSTLILSSTTLREVSIHLEFGALMNYDHQGPSPVGCLLFLQTITQHLTDHYPNLRKIELLAPICISFEVGVDQIGSKFFLLTPRRQSFFSDGDFPTADTACLIMRCARDFVGTGLTEFHLDTDRQVMDSEWYEEILSELWNSRSTLQHLELDKPALNTRKAWELVTGSRNLLNRGYDTAPYQPGIDLRVGAGAEIGLQEVAEVESFKNVSISSISGWRSLVKWIGNGRGLELLNLCGGHVSEEEENQEVAEDLSPSGLSLGHILRNARDTLEDLHLSGNALGPLNFLHSPTSTLSFPRLRVLRLEHCSLQVWSAISKLQSLQLFSLTVEISLGNRSSKNYRALQQSKAFDCLVSILRGNPTLTSVDFSTSGKSSSSTLQKHLELHHSTSKLSFKFHSLKIRSPTASRWFSQHHYPDLKKLEVDEEYQSQFKNIPNELQRQIEARISSLSTDL